MRKELVCVQVGTTANFVGAHFWNLHDEYLAIPPHERELSPAPFFRPIAPTSLAARSGLRYAPRLQIIDASGAFGALSTDAGVVLPQLSAPDTASTHWDSSVQRYLREPVRRSAYVKTLLEEESGVEKSEGTGVESDVEYWSDFLKTRLHPRTCFPLPGVHQGVAKLDKFEVGGDIAAQPLLDDVFDDLRFFIEECDSFGGLSIITSADDAYAGFVAKYLQYLSEELGASSAVAVFAVHNIKRTCTRKTAQERAVNFDPIAEMHWARNEAVLAGTCMDFAAEYVPMSPALTRRVSLLHTRKEDVFHSSAVLGLALNVALTPLQTNLSLAGILGALRPVPFAAIGGISCNLPNADTAFSYGANILDTNNTANFSNPWDETPQNPLTGNPSRREQDISRCTEIVSGRGLGSSLPIFSNVAAPVTIPLPFPTIFDASLERNKYARAENLAANPRREGLTAIEQVGVISGLVTNPNDAQSTLTSLGKALRPQIGRSRAFAAEEADVSEIAESLISRAVDYETV